MLAMPRARSILHSIDVLLREVRLMQHNKDRQAQKHGYQAVSGKVLCLGALLAILLVLNRRRDSIILLLHINHSSDLRDVAIH